MKNQSNILIKLLKNSLNYQKFINGKVYINIMFNIKIFKGDALNQLKRYD